MLFVFFFSTCIIGHGFHGVRRLLYTCFPEAIPMGKITSSAVVKALVKFFSLFGLLRAVQTDQGSYFMSQPFTQVMKQLDITHHYSSAYHPERAGGCTHTHLPGDRLVC